MTFVQAVVQCVQSLHLTKPVTAVIQLQTGDIIVACEDKYVYLYTSTNGLFELKTKVQMSKTPHTIGYDYIRNIVYVGCNAGIVEIVQLLHDNEIYENEKQEQASQKNDYFCTDQYSGDDIMNFKSEFIQETFLNPKESLMTQYNRFLKRYNTKQLDKQLQNRDYQHIKFDNIVKQLQESPLQINEKIPSFKQMKKIAKLQPSKREICHIIYARDSDVILCTGFDGILTIFNAETREIISQAQLSKTPVRYLCYDEISGLLYTGTHEEGIVCFRLRNPKTGEMPKFEFVLGNDGTELSHENPVRSIIMDKQSRFLFSSDHKGKILVWQAGAPDKEERTEALGQILGCENVKVRSLRWMSQYRALFSGDAKGNITIHHPTNKKINVSVQGHRGEIMGLTPVKLSINNTDTDCTISFGKDGVVKVWNTTFS